MRTRVVTVNTDDSARLAVLLMLEEGVGSVAVCDSGRLVGIFTERDVLSLAGDGTDLEAVKIGDVMTRAPLTVDVGVPVLDAARLMGERKIRHLPVVEGDHLLGMVESVTSSAASSSVSGSRRIQPRTTQPFRAVQELAQARGTTRPDSYATTTAWARSRSPSLRRTWLTWVLTVSSLSTSRLGDLVDWTGPPRRGRGSRSRAA